MTTNSVNFIIQFRLQRSILNKEPCCWFISADDANLRNPRPNQIWWQTRPFCGGGSWTINYTVDFSLVGMHYLAKLLCNWRKNYKWNVLQHGWLEVRSINKVQQLNWYIDFSMVTIWNKPSCICLLFQYALICLTRSDEIKPVWSRLANFLYLKLILT